jgi:hypothetical protein
MNNEENEMKYLFIKTVAGVVLFKGIKEVRLERTEDELNDFKELKGLCETQTVELETKINSEMLCNVVNKNGEELYTDIIRLYEISSFVPFELFNSMLNEIVQKYNVPWQFVIGLLENMSDAEKETKKQ